MLIVSLRIAIVVALQGGQVRSYTLETVEPLVLSEGEDKNLLANVMSLQIQGGGWTSPLLDSRSR